MFRKSDLILEFKFKRREPGPEEENSRNDSINIEILTFLRSSTGVFCSFPGHLRVLKLKHEGLIIFPREGRLRNFGVTTDRCLTHIRDAAHSESRVFKLETDSGYQKCGSYNRIFLDQIGLGD